MAKILGDSDHAVEQVATALEEYEKTNDEAECFVCRYNPASIRIKIVDTTFHGQPKGERHDYARRFLTSLPEDIVSQVSVLLCLEPGESSLLDLEFRDPTRSSL